MARYLSTEECVTTIARNDRGDFIKVCRVIPDNPKSLESIDIRNFFTNDDGDLCPTQKGVRIHTEILMDVVIAIVEAMSPSEQEEFMERLGDVNYGE